MDLETLDLTLRESIEDRRLSRSERKDLRGWFHAYVADAQDAGLVRNRAFEIARELVAAEPDRAAVAWLEDVVGLLAHHVGRDTGTEAEAFFSPGHDCLGTVVGALRSTRRSADICVFTITDDRITKAILEAARRGVALRVVSDDEKADDLGSDLDRLAEAGVPLALDRSEAHMHHKFAIFDGARLLTGSFNWTRSASHGNHENLLLTTDERLLRAYQAEFDRLWGAYRPA